MYKWKWVKDNYSYLNYGETHRLYRYKEIDCISVGNKIASVFQFELMSKNVQLTSNCLEKYNWLKDCYFVMDFTADMGASYIYHAIKDKQYDFGVCIDYGVNEGSDLQIPLSEFKIIGDDEMELQYLIFAYDIIKGSNRGNDSLLFDSVSNDDWDRLININQKFPDCLTPISLLKQIKSYVSELELTLDTYQAENSWDTVSCTLGDYNQHLDNHKTMAKLLYLYKFMTADSNWKILNVSN
tara:strand:+ start:1882 stop:2601 length:720 start_codon:yes stop_codon:yes gene_type:complete